mmetsp:Transcript_49477/g.115720  ORF Transcript_49477/g.115720 Transcript_49477/m.115720 type:complete len:706 (-) Transcript_49477:15-2132(-)
MANALDGLLESVRTAHAEALVEIETQNVALKAEIARLTFPNGTVVEGGSVDVCQSADDKEVDWCRRLPHFFLHDPLHQTPPAKVKLKATFQESSTEDFSHLIEPTGESQPKQRLKSHMDAAESHADVASKPRPSGTENPHQSHSASHSISGSSNSFRVNKHRKAAQIPDEVRDPIIVGHCSDQLLRALDHMKSTRLSSMAVVTRSEREGSLQSLLEKTRSSDALYMLRRAIHNIKFDFFCTLVILFNGVILGAEVHVLASGCDAPASFFYIDVMVVSWYCIELLLRLWADRLAKDLWWNFFDFLMVIASIADLAVDVDTIPSQYHFLRFLRFARMLRILKVLRMGKRMNRYFLVLSKMTLSMSHSLPSLLSAAVVLIFVTYFCAVMLTQTATDYREQQDMLSFDTIGLKEHFGSLDRTFYSLTKSIFNGQNWGQLLQPLTHVGVAPSAIFLLYVLLSFLCFLNVIHAVFVDSAIQSTNKYKEFSMAEAQQRKVLLLNDLREVFQEIDTDNSGFVTTSEFDACLSTDGGKAFFEVLGLSAAQANELFRLMDADGSGSVDIDEFLDGCTRFTGEAKNFDIQCILLENRQAMAKWNFFLDNFETVLTNALAASKASTSPKRAGASFNGFLSSTPGSSNVDIANMQGQTIELLPPGMSFKDMYHGASLKNELPVLEESGQPSSEEPEPALQSPARVSHASGNIRHRQAL